MKKLGYVITLIMVIVMTAQLAVAACDISGDIVATPNPDLSGPDWVYTLTIDWDTGSQHALSHMDLLLDTSTGTCSCADFSDALSWADPIGSSDGDPSCTVDYEGQLECNGDPSIPGVDNILLKFEPIEEGCEPGVTGTATFVFYSNLGPTPVDEDILSLVDKFANNSCFGTLTGDFPSMTCDPVNVEGIGWGSLKGSYN